MQQTKNTAFRKVLSVVLTVVMAFGYLGLFSGVLNLNPTAEAAEAGPYHVHVKARVTNGTQDKAWGEAELQVKYKTINGTESGTEIWSANYINKGNANGPDSWDNNIDIDEWFDGFPVELYLFCRTFRAVPEMAGLVDDPWMHPAGE